MFALYRGKVLVVSEFDTDIVWLADGDGGDVEAKITEVDFL